jgi:O-antigen/teichoic acid export membrane protein
VGYSVYNVSLLLLGIIVARSLGKEGFGELGIIQSTIGVLGLIAGLGLGITATKFIAEFRDKDPVKVGNILALSTVFCLASGGILSLLLVIFAPVLADAVFHAPQLTFSLQISAGLVLGGAVSGAQIGALSGFEAFKKIALINIAMGILLVPVTVVMLDHFGLNGVLAASVMVVWTGIVLNRIALVSEYRNQGLAWSVRDWRTESGIILTFSLPAILAALVVSAATWIVNTMLIHQPGGFDELGVLNAAIQWRTMLLFLPGIIALVSIPILAERHGNDGYGAMAQLLKHLLIITSVVMVPATILVCIFSPVIMQQYGADFSGTGTVLVLIAFSALFMGLSVPVGNMIAASGRMWVWFLMNLGWAVVLIGCARVLLPWGALGIAGALLAAYFIHLLWTTWYALRVISSGSD